MISVQSKPRRFAEYKSGKLQAKTYLSRMLSFNPPPKKKRIKQTLKYICKLMYVKLDALKQKNINNSYVKT